ncbi:MAG: M16 family metallopeptidase [Terriglobales bacterium]
MRRLPAVLVLLLALAACAPPVPAQNLAQFEKRVTEFTLANGMHFIVLERHEAPVVSFVTYANVGAVDDPKGETGMAHMFEHMAFKGTREIGTKNWPAEKAALDAVDRAYEALEAERRRGFRSDPKKIAALEAEFKHAETKAESYVIPNEYPRLIEINGGVGLNAFTQEDATVFFYSLPSNRTELWFYLESSRFLHPIFREFYKERDVVREERRMRTESNPEGQLVEDLLAAAYQAHPYKNPPVGWASDIENLTIAEARRFYAAHYAPANLTEAIVGDVEPAQIKRWAEEYFGRIPAGPRAERIITVEPPQNGERIVRVVSPSQPFLLIAYHKPSEYDPDKATFDVISSILSDGRTSWLYTSLVRDKKIALDAGGIPGYPGTKYPNLFVFYDVPAAGHTVAENETAMLAQVERLKTTLVDAATLKMVQTKARAELIRELGSNAGMAQELAFYYTNFGDWRQLFRHLDQINHVTAADVQRVARKYFQPRLRTVAYLVQPSPGGTPAAATASGGAR